MRAKDKFTGVIFDNAAEYVGDDGDTVANVCLACQKLVPHDFAFPFPKSTCDVTGCNNQATFSYAFFRVKRGE